METIALYIGYAVLVVLGLVLAALAGFTVYLTAVGIYRIIYSKKSIRFMIRAEAKAINKGGRCAYEFLIKNGCSESDTLKDVADILEKHKIRHKL